jgi:hypothetical protein
MEQVAYEDGSGQLLTASFMEYAMPARRHAVLIWLSIATRCRRSSTPLGAKGAGEAGTVGALPVVICAILNALAPLGVRDIGMPATSESVWRAIEDAAHHSEGLAEEEFAMTTMLDDAGLDLILRKARTQNGWLDKPVSDDQLGRSTASCGSARPAPTPVPRGSFSFAPQRRKRGSCPR